jgi:hypothetical protein
MKRFVALGITFTLALAGTQVRAAEPGSIGSGNDPRPFTMVEDTYPEGKGAFEIENTVEYGHRTHRDHGLNTFDFEHELEFGLADNFDLKIPIAYHYEDTANGSGFGFDDIGIQGDVYLTNSFTDPVGVALMGEVNVGEDVLGLELTLVLQKDFGNWVVAYNLGAETEISGVFNSDVENETEGVLVNSLGAAYSVGQNMRIGGQVLAESTYADWNDYEGTVVYAGPTFSYFGGRKWWLTVGPNFLLTNQQEEAEFRLDLIFGITF